MSGGIEAEIKQRAKTLGLADLRITDASVPMSRQQAYRQFLEAGRHGEMAWLAHRQSSRMTPRNLWPEAQSAIVCTINYGPDTDPLAVLAKKDRGGISVYAQNRDYHDVLKGRLKEIAGILAARTGAAVKVFVDTAPILEKPLAERAGIGWQGKHTNLVSRQFGSWLFLGEILTTANLKFDAPETDHCGQCRRCLDICPTNAFPEPYKLDARRCIAYLTIEHAGHIDREYRAAIGNRIYGCDDCLAVCPWNKFARTTQEAKLQGLDANVEPKLAELLELDDPAFRVRFAGSPIKRIGRDRFIRNVLIAAGNSGDLELVDRCQDKLRDPSTLVRAAAIWALSQLLSCDAFRAMRSKHCDNEDDHAVRCEWEMAV